MSGYEEDRKRYSKTPLDDVTKEARLISYARPASARRVDHESIKTPKRHFSRLHTGNKVKKSLLKEKNTILIEKLRPNRIIIDKERLYIENMQLKLRNNELAENIIKYKARFLQLQREKQKKEDNPMPNLTQSSYLVKLLKQTIKELKSELQNKDIEIAKQKRNIKLSKYLEMELELKTYADECTRLKHYLEEILLEKDQTLKEKDQIHQFSRESLLFPDSKTQNFLKVIEENNKEIQKLKNKLRTGLGKKSPKAKEDSAKQLRDLEKLKLEFQVKETKFHQEISNLQSQVKSEQGKFVVISEKLEEANKLIESMRKEIEFTKQREIDIDQPRLLQVLNNLISELNKSVSELFVSISPDSLNFIDSSKFLLELAKFDNSLTKVDLDLVIDLVQGKDSGEISLLRLLNVFQSSGFKLSMTDQKRKLVLELFKHVELRMQLHRVPKENLLETLTGNKSSGLKEIDCQEIVMVFTNAPFSFSRNEAICIAQYLFNGEKTMKYLDFTQKFYSATEDWEVFTPKDEENFDSYLINFVSKHLTSLDTYCSECDQLNKGIIKLQEFRECLDKLGVILPQRVLNYLLVLFYSHSLDLNSVPYKQFLQAYTTHEEAISHEEQRDIIFQKYLSEISQGLLAKEKSVRDVFQYDTNGNVLAEDFIKALEMLEIPEIPTEELLIVLEGLTHSPEDRVICVDIQDLEDLCQNYGVPIETLPDESDNESLAEDTNFHVQKVSLLDSAQLNLIESPE